jgi:predicted PurR-regulated permease PerM
LVGILVIIAVTFGAILPTLLVQFASLATDVIPEGVREVVNWWQDGTAFEQFPWLETVAQDVTFNERVINQALGQIGEALSQVSGSVLPFVGGVANVILSLLIIFFISVYLVAEPEVYISRVIVLTPLWYRQRMREILDRMDSTARAWIRITGVSMLVAGVGTALGLTILGVEEAIALGVLAGFASFIPNFGPLVALIPAIAVGIVEMPQNVGWIIVIIYGVSFLQNQVVGPILANENLNLPPVFVLLGQIIFGIFFGFLGIMFAVPMTALLLVLVDEIYVKDVLGDKSQDEKEGKTDFIVEEEDLLAEAD